MRFLNTAAEAGLAQAQEETRSAHATTAAAKQEAAQAGKLADAAQNAAIEAKIETAAVRDELQAARQVLNELRIQVTEARAGLEVGAIVPAGSVHVFPCVSAHTRVSSVFSRGCDV